MINIRRAKPGDADELKRCACAAYGKYTERIGRPAGPMRADYDAIAKGEGAFVAEVAGKIVGMLVLVKKSGGIVLDNVALLPDCQGRGIGRRLVEFAEEEARRLGFTQIDLYTNEGMRENIALYAHLGFKETARKTEYGYRRVYMKKIL